MGKEIIFVGRDRINIKGDLATFSVKRGAGGKEVTIGFRHYVDDVDLRFTLETLERIKEGSSKLSVAAPAFLGRAGEFAKEHGISLIKTKPDVQDVLAT